MLRKVIVPLDGSSRSESAIAPARAVATRADASLVLVTTRWGSDVSSPRRYIEARASAIDDGEARLILDREPVDAISFVASEDDDALVCMATHGRGGVRGTVMGSVAEAVVRTIRGPVMLIGPDNKLGESLPASPHVLVGLDGSDTSNAVLPAAIELARALHADIRVVQVVLTTDVIKVTRQTTAEATPLEDVVERIRDADVDAHYEIVDDGDISARIATYAAELPASIVALATHGRSGLARVALGSVAMRVVRRSECPALVVRPCSLT